MVRGALAADRRSGIIDTDLFTYLLSKQQLITHLYDRKRSAKHQRTLLM